MNPAFLFSLAGFVLLSATSSFGQECPMKIPVNKIISSPGRTYRLEDGRELSGAVYNVGGCLGYPAKQTGTAVAQHNNYTLMGQNTPTTSSACLVKNFGGAVTIYDSMQAIVVRSSNWKFVLNNVNIEDIDSQINVPFSDAWKESTAIFGLADGKLVNPTVSLYPNTLLRMKKYAVPSAALLEMGLSLTDIIIPGAEYGANFLHNCGIGSVSDSALCRMTAKFSQEIDTLVILLALTHKGTGDWNSHSFVSDMSIACSCRCSLQIKESTSLVPVAGKPNECIPQVATRKGWYCDFMGDYACLRDLKSVYIGNGTLANGHIRCLQEQRRVVRAPVGYKQPSPLLAPTPSPNLD